MKIKTYHVIGILSAIELIVSKKMEYTILIWFIYGYYNFIME